MFDRFKTKIFHQNKLDVVMGGRDAWNIIVKSVVVKITACVSVTARVVNRGLCIIAGEYI